MGNKTVATVVVPTIGRSSIGDTLLSLKAQSMPVKILEITEPSGAERKGIGWARNMGIKKARTPYVLFLDDDCIADRRWAELMVADLKKYHVVGATIVPRFDGKKPPWFESVKGLYSINEDAPWITGCSFGIQKKIRPRFDEAKFRGVYCEDDFFFKECETAGYKIKKSKARVYHCIPRLRLGIPYLIKRSFIQGRSKHFQISSGAFKELFYITYYQKFNSITQPVFYGIFFMSYLGGALYDIIRQLLPAKR